MKFDYIQALDFYKRVYSKHNPFTFYKVIDVLNDKLNYPILVDYLAGGPAFVYKIQN